MLIERIFWFELDFENEFEDCKDVVLFFDELFFDMEFFDEEWILIMLIKC